MCEHDDFDWRDLAIATSLAEEIADSERKKRIQELIEPEEEEEDADDDSD